MGSTIEFKGFLVSLFLLCPLFLPGVFNASEPVGAQPAGEPLYSQMDTESILNHLLSRPNPYVHEPPDADKDGGIDVADLVMTINGNPPVDLDQIVPLVDLHLSTGSVGPGGSVELSWDAKGVDALSSYSLQIVAVTPGRVPTGLLEALPGVVPGNGAVYYLQSGAPLGLEYDYWTLQETSFRVGGVTTDRTATVRPYEDLPGEWLIQARLLQGVGPQGSQSYEVVAADQERLLVTDRPAMRLRLNRAIANTGDDVRAEIITAAGATPTAVSLAAWLQTPDGAEVWLPNFEPGLYPLWTGPARDGVTPLFEQPLGEWGEGRFVVRASLVDDATGRLLALAAAPLLIRDTLSTVSGGVLADLGGETPINGPSFDVAQVQALEIHDQEHTVADVDATGTYTLTLRPGSYLLSALVLDQLNVYEQSVGIVEIAGGEQVSRNVVMDSLYSAEGSGLSAQSLASIGSKSVRLARAPGGPPKPKVVVYINIDQNAYNGQLETLARSYVEELRRQMPEVEIHTPDEIASLLNNGQFDAAEDILNSDYLMRITLYDLHVDSAVRCGMYPTVLTRSDVRALSRDAIYAPTDTELLQNARQTAQQKGPALQQVLILNQEWPKRPTIKLQLIGSNFWPGQTIGVRVTLSEDDGTPVDGKTLKVQHWQGPIFDTRIGEVTGVTGATGPGQFVASFPIPQNVPAGTEGPQCELRAIYERNGRQWEQRRRYSILPVGSGPGLRLFDPVGHGFYFASYLPGDDFLVYFSLKDDQSNPRAGVSVDSWCVNCTANPATAVTDVNGIAEFTVTPGERNGYAVIQASCQPPGDPFPPAPARFPFQVIGGMWIQADTGSHQQPRLSLQRQATPDVEGLVPILVDVFKGEDRIPAVPVTLTLSGAGSLLGGQTQSDAEGVAHALFSPPEMRSGTATLTATAQIGDETASATLDVEYDPGLVVQAYIPNFIDDQGNGALEVRVGRPQASGLPVWEQDAQIDVTAGGGTVTPASGVTGVDGRFSAQIQAADAEAGMDLIIQATAGDGKTASKTIRAVHSGLFLYVYALAQYVAYHDYDHQQIFQNSEEETFVGGGNLARQFDLGMVGVTALSEAGHVRASTRASIDQSSIMHYYDVWRYGWARCTVRDTIQINDPEHTGEWGTARIIVRFSDTGWARGIGLYPYVIGASVVHLECGYYHDQSWIYQAGTSALPHNIWNWSQSPMIWTLTFRYGIPVEVSLMLEVWSNAEVFREAYGYLGQLYADTGDAADAYLTIVPDNPNATVTSASGHRY